MTRYTADRVRIERTTDHYYVEVERTDGRTVCVRGGLLNVGGRTFAVDGDAELGAGETTLTVEHLDDDRAPYGLVAIRFGAEIGLREADR